ncbi:MAG: protease pro-enzyme activation domain-containing protein, partial [Thermoplasmatota archaeon]
MGRQPKSRNAGITNILAVAWAIVLVASPLFVGAAGADDANARVAMSGSLSPLAKQVTDLGVAPDAFPVHFNVGLDLQNKDALDAFLADVSDPASPDYQHFLTQDDFNAKFGPTPEQELRVIDWLTSSGFTVTGTFSNRLLVAASGDNAAVKAAFGVPVHLVLLHGAPHYAVLDPPTFPADIAAFSTGVVGLDDLVSLRAMHIANLLPLGPSGPLGGVTPKAAVGGSCCSMGPQDIRNFYNNPETSDGTGQTVVIAGAYAYQTSDINTYDSQFSLPALPTGSANVCTGASGSAACQFDVSNSIEVSLDLQMIHATAPGAVVKNYMAATTANADFQTMYNKVVTDNPGHSVTTSWGSCESGNSAAQLDADDNIFANGNAVGESWFAASGDNGSDDCQNGTADVDHPADTPHVMGVGGTTPTCSPAMTASHPSCDAYGSETAWSGSGGGKSTHWTKPAFQTGCSVPADGQRDVPDMSMEADPSPGNWVINGGTWQGVGGTSDAAPQMGGIFAQLNQAQGGSGLGLPGTRIYQLCGGNSFHDITSGSNGAYSAAAGYDQVTGVGTTNVGNFMSNWASTPTVPGAPTGFTATAASGQVSLSWTAPANGGSAITNYKIYRATTSGSETSYSQTGGSNTSYVDKKVTNGVTYYYKVSAVNAVGEGAKSAEASATPNAATAPGAPTGLAATAGNAQVSLSWTAPSSNGGSAITNYKIYRGTTSGSETSYSATGGSNTSYVDKKATNGQIYYYKVSAVNSVGEGALSNEASATPVACSGNGPSND